MVRYLALNFSEMRQVKVSGVQGANFGDRVMPLFDVQLRWNERWDWWTKTDPHAGNVAAKDAIIPMINVMMAGVSGCCNRADLEWRKLNDFAVLQHFNAICRHSRNAPPKFFHFIAKDAFSGSDEFCRINQVRKTARMPVNRGAEFCKTPGRARMIEMDVTKKHMAHVSWLEADLSQLANNSLERRFRPSVEENQATIGFQCCDRDDIRPTKVVGIEYVNFQRIRSFKIDGALASGDPALEDHQRWLAGKSCQPRRLSWQRPRIRSRTRFVGNCQSRSDERTLASANLSCMRSLLAEL